MFEVFIVEKVNGDFEVLQLQDNFDKILEGSFLDAKVEQFETNFVIGKKITLPEFDEDMLVLLNGACGKYYYLDYDFSRYSVTSFGKQFYKANDYTKDLEKVTSQILKINAILSSNTLLTRTKKDEIKDQIKEVFFLIAGIDFHLHKLLQKNIQNLQELRTINNRLEFESTAELIAETNKTKNIELKATIEKLENRAKEFYKLISKAYIY